MTSHSASGASCGSDSDAEEESRDATLLSPDRDKKKKKKKRQSAMEEEENKKKGKDRKKREEEEEEEQEEAEEKRGDDEEEDERSQSVLLRGIFRLGKISHDVLLTSTRLSWTPILPEMPTVQVSESQSWDSIPLRDVFAVKVKRRRSVGQQTGGPVLGVTLFYGRTTVGRRLTDDKLHLHNSSVQHCDVWFRTIKHILSGFSTRPKRVLVFINPGSHKKEAVHIYRQHVAPLFNMADLKTDITITEKKGHALSVLKECNLDEFDGVVCVGGDGSVAEIAHGLVLRAQLEDQEDRESWTLSDDEPKRAPLPLGIIPAGSTDIVSCSVHGVRHPPTAALHIIMGHLQPVDMCSFSSQGRLVTFGFSAMFGFGGRSLALAERKRWMPTTQRRDYALLKALAKLRPVDCDLSFLPAVSDQSSFEDGSKETYTEGEEAWLQTNQGLYLNISIMSIPCLSPHTPYGLSKTRVANGSGELIAVGNTSRSEFIKHLKRYGSKTGQFDFPFVEKHTVAAVKLRPRLPIGWQQQQQEEESEDSQEVDDPKATPILSSDSKGFPWNIDGELICIPNEVLVRVHSRLITLYGGEVESAEEATISCSCI